MRPTTRTPLARLTLHPITHPLTSTRPLSSTTPLPKKSPLPPRPKLDPAETYKSYLKGSGPGGQKINKTSSAVQLTHLPTGIVVKSQATRSRTQNESIARRLLAEKVEVLEKGAESRVERKRQLESRKTRSGEKKRRRKYRALEVGEKGQEAEGEDVEEDDIAGEGEGEGRAGGESGNGGVT